MVIDMKHHVAQEVSACAEQHEQAGSAVSALVLREVALWLEGKGPLPAPPKLTAYAAKPAPEDDSAGEPSAGARRLSQAMRYGRPQALAHELDVFAQWVRRGA